MFQCENVPKHAGKITQGLACLDNQRDFGGIKDDL